MTADSYLGDINSPPSLHRYMYANANPLRYVDPTGHFSLEDVTSFARDAGTTFAGYTYGVGKVALAPVTFVYNTAYNVTGGVAFAATGRQEFRAQYEALASVNDTFASVQSGGDAVRLAGRVVTAPIKNTLDAFDRGDVFGTGAGLGETVGQGAALYATASSAASRASNVIGRLPPPGGAPQLAFEAAGAGGQTGAVALAGGPVPGSSVPAGWLLASGANSGKAVTMKEGGKATETAPANGGEAPKSGVTSPNTAARRASQGSYVDPRSNKVVQTTAPLAADHIIPQRYIKQLEGFKLLSVQQKSTVLNYIKNFQGLPKSFNSSKQGKLPSEFVKYKGEDLDPAYIARNQALEQTLIEDLRRMIEDFLQANAKAASLGLSGQ